MAKKNEEGVVKAGNEETAVTQKATKKVASETKAFSLPTGKVHVKPIVRSGRWLPIGHSGAFMYDHTVLGIQVPVDRQSGRLKNPLTKEEQRFFENDAGLDLKQGDLNPYKKTDNYWTDFRVSIRKSDEIVTDNTILMTLDLSDPMDYLQYKVLLSNTKPDGGIVAPSWQDKFMSGTYKIALVHEGQQNTDKVKRADQMEKVYKYLGKIDSSDEAMFDFLTIYYLENGKSKRPSEDSTKSFYKSEIQDLIDNNLEQVVKIIDDAANYEYKLLVHRGLKIGALVMVSGDKIETVDGRPVGNGLHQAIQWFKDDRHQDDYLTLKNQIELAK
jgi:hypothetical protein